MEFEENCTEYVPIAKRRAIEAQKILQSKRKTLISETDTQKKPKLEVETRPSLLAKTNQLKYKQDEVTLVEHQVQQEKEMLKNLSYIKTLVSVRELAKGITYSDALPTGWKAPLHIRRISRKSCDDIRRKLHIVVDGEEIPPPVRNFEDMRLPEPILKKLQEKKIVRPTPIQVQALPAILSGRDVIGVAHTGSGKTLAFVLPLIMMALQEEIRMPIAAGEGPFGLVVCPSRELAKQTFEIIEEFLAPLRECGFPEITPLLCIGGVSMRTQLDTVKKGVHIVVATPGRLKDTLAKKKMNLVSCRYLTLDEADRLLDLGFEDDIKEVMDHFKDQRQTILFSATMPPKVQNFVQTILVKPVTINVGRANTVNYNIVQEIDYVKHELKLAYLLKSLEKTQPPVLVFCVNKADVDNVYDYLIIKGVEVVAIHGGKDQEERDYSISSFKAGKKDVLVATDVASKGLDFSSIQHVINYDMPSNIEDYIHRIGRTGRCDKTGIATTFINKNQNENTLRDLKHLLLEAKQRIPPFLSKPDDLVEDVDMITNEVGMRGCGYCGGLGHRILNCHKLDHQKGQQMRNYFGLGGYKAEI